VEEFLLPRLRAQKTQFQKATQTSISITTRINEYLSPVFFILAILWIASGKIGFELAAIGLFSIVTAEVIHSGNLYKPAYQIIELKKPINKENLYARLVSNTKEEIFEIHEDWMKTVIYLADNQWEILEISSSAQEANSENGYVQSALFKRRYRWNLLRDFIKQSKLPVEIIEED